MNIALLGGAFNPPHLGHAMIARQILDFTPTDEVWLLPNYHQIPPKPVAAVADRVAMTKYLESDNIRLSNIEVEQRLDGDTVHLIPYLLKQHSYHFVIGSDQLTSFHLWGNWKSLLQRMPFYVFPRYGYPNEPLYEGMSVISHELLIASNISSTKIRARVEQNKSITQFVPREVADYIRSHGLYKE
ncbi:nicotinate (nicotinamide) nucleotide adenylyltransferase [Candidatus Gottesmanbacteria bacterium]|nr:nicotinate (nicotinamide) nucleotide adenylyltransferase [Candidatus Gottesmanbacteria bacterium]